MTLSTPWHSSNTWQPTEVIQFINHLDSGAGTLIVRTDAGQAYFKALGNPDGPHALVKDLLGTHLAAMLGLPTFDYAVIEVTDLELQPSTFAANKEEVNFNRALKFSLEGKILQDNPNDPHGQLKFNVIGRFASMSDPSIPIVRKVLQESDVRLHLEHDLSGLIDEIRRTGKPRPRLT